MIVPVNVVRARDFGIAWVDLLTFICSKKYKITFGDGNDRKEAYDSNQIVVLYEDAIQQVLAGEVHPNFPFRGARLEGYCAQFNRKFLKKYNARDDNEKFDYMYYDRIINYPAEYDTYDQLQAMRRSLHWQIVNDLPSNHCQAVTWIPSVDMSGKCSTPCFQRIWIRYVDGNQVDVHLDWRSRDAYGAWQANLVAICRMLYNEVLMPNKCVIRSLTDYCDSLHVYLTDLAAIKQVSMNPQLISW